jgi:hypothetical protein
MKNLFSIFKLFTIVLLGTMVLTACDKSQAQPQEQTQEGQGTEVTKTETKTDQAVLDSIKTITVKTDSICKKQDELCDQLNTIDNQVKEVKRSSSLYELVAVSCGLLALILAIIALAKAIGNNKRLDRHRNEIDDLKRQLTDSKFQPNNYTNASSSRNNNSSDYYKLASRIDSLEKKLNSPKAQPTRKEDNPPIVIDNPVSQKRDAFFGTPSQAQGDSAYFKKEFKYKDTEVMFSAEITGDNAEFKPIEGNTASLGTLKSSDTMKLAVQFEGCAPSEANSMQVLLPGIAKFDGERWYIKKKTVVRLIK